MDPCEESRAQASPSPVASFFSLSRETRNDIYRRVLIIRHPLYLFQDTGSQTVETFAPERPVRWLALLYTNKRVHAEASAVLYGLNQFTFVDTTRHQVNLVQSFLSLIGPVNAGHLSHICINFPVAQSMKSQAGEATITEDELCLLKDLREKCHNLTTLETFVHDRNSMGLTEASRDSVDPHFVRDALSQVDAQLNTIASLRKIIVRFYNGPPTSEVREMMQHLRWVILPAQ